LTDRESDRWSLSAKVSIPGGDTHVLHDAELLRYIKSIFFDIHAREECALGGVYRTGNGTAYTGAGSAHRDVNILG
jgi:hypothetical protein